MSPLFLAILLISTAASTSIEAAVGPDVVTNLEFYFHDIVTGSNPTAKRVIQPLSASSTTLFGMVNMADDPLTETADPKSKLVGRAQGLYGSSGQKDIALLMAMSYSFEAGPYKGSTLSIMGKNPAMNPTRELPVLGGTGVFRMARGYAVLKTVSLNAAGDAVVHYNVTVYTPADNGASSSPVSGSSSSARSSNAVDGASSSAAKKAAVYGKLWLISSVIGSICLFTAL